MLAFLGLSPLAWLLCAGGAAVCVFAVIVVICTRRMSEGDRRCPNCASPVEGEAVLCEHCGAFLG
jgi:hypothetical protein